MKTACSGKPALVVISADPNARNNVGQTPLHVAAAGAKSPEVIVVLLAAGADPWALDDFVMTPWNLAQENDALEGTDAYKQPNVVGENFTIEEHVPRFELFANCWPMRLIVGKLDSDAAKTSLVMESIKAAAESRLRSARLYSAIADPMTYIEMGVVGAFFSSRLQYNKWSDPL